MHIRAVGIGFRIEELLKPTTMAVWNAGHLAPHPQIFGVGRGQAWRWLERLERAGLVYVTEDPLALLPILPRQSPRA